MAQTIEHIAIESGTLSNPYRFIEKGQKVHLTKEDAEFYKGSWLRPTKEGQKIIDTPPHFPNVNVTGSHLSGINGIQAMEQLADQAASSDTKTQYDTQMEAVIERENAEDDVNSGEEQQQAGTGDLDPLA